MEEQLEDNIEIKLYIFPVYGHFERGVEFNVKNVFTV